MLKAKLFSVLIALFIIQNVAAKPLDETETVTATPKELTEMEKFIIESSNVIAEKFRKMFKEEIIANVTYPELKWFQETLFIIKLLHDDAKTIGDHMEFVQYFVEMMKESMNLTADNVTPELKAIEDLFEKYECRQLAFNIEKKFRELKSEEERKKILEIGNVNGEKSE